MSQGVCSTTPTHHHYSMSGRLVSKRDNAPLHLLGHDVFCEIISVTFFDSLDLAKGKVILIEEHRVHLETSSLLLGLRAYRDERKRKRKGKRLKKIDKHQIPLSLSLPLLP